MVWMTMLEQEQEQEPMQGLELLILLAENQVSHR
jgi:hypothetical protein